MNEQNDFERLVADQLSNAAVGAPPESAIEDTIARAGGSRRLPEWLALIKEPPMRSNSHLAVGSPTVRVMAILAATLLLAVALAAAGAGAERLLASESPIIVAQDGSGHYATIQEAVDSATDGDVIDIRPGRYVEGVAVVGKDLTVAGDGDRDEIILEHDPSFGVADIDWSGLWEEGDEPYPTALLVADSHTTLTGITVVAPHDTDAVLVLGPEAIADISGISVRSLGEVPGGINAINWEGGARGSLRDSHVEGWVGLNDGANVIVEDNDMPATCLGVWEEGADVVIRGNVIHGCEYEKGLEILGDNSALIEGNDIWVEEVEPGPPEPGWGGRVAITVDSTGTVTIRDNDLHDSKTGVRLIGGSRVVVDENRVTANETGVSADHWGAVELSGNVIELNDVGLVLGGLADSTLEGNRICDNDVNVQLTNLASSPDAASNEICEDTPIE